MDIRHLRYFIAVAEELHFGRAAQRLHLSQSPLSRQIRALEQEVGVALLARTKHLVQLTDAGAGFLTHARQLVGQSELAVAEARRTGRGEAGCLRVGYVSTALYTVVGTLLNRYRAQFPQVALALHELPTAAQVAGLRAGTLHLGFGCLPVLDDTLATQVVQHPQVMAALPTQHPLTAQPSVPLAALAAEPMVMISKAQEPGLHQRYVAACQAAGFVPRVVQECAEVHSIIGLVAQSLGVGLVPDSLDINQREGVVWRPVTPAVTLELAAIWSPADESPTLRGFRKSCLI